MKSVKHPYEIAEIDDLRIFLEKLPSLTEREMYDLSLVREPRNSNRNDVK